MGKGRREDEVITRSQAEAEEGLAGSMTARPFTWRGRAGGREPSGHRWAGWLEREGGRPGWKWSEAVRRDQAGNIPGPGPLGVLGPGGGGTGRQRRDACAQRGVGQKANRPKATDCLQDTPPFFFV